MLKISSDVRFKNVKSGQKYDDILDLAFACH